MCPSLHSPLADQHNCAETLCTAGDATVFSEYSSVPVADVSHNPPTPTQAVGETAAGLVHVTRAPDIDTNTNGGGIHDTTSYYGDKFIFFALCAIIAHTPISFLTIFVCIYFTNIWLEYGPQMQKDISISDVVYLAVTTYSVMASHLLTVATILSTIHDEVGMNLFNHTTLMYLTCSYGSQTLSGETNVDDMTDTIQYTTLQHLLEQQQAQQQAMNDATNVSTTRSRTTLETPSAHTTRLSLRSLLLQFFTCFLSLLLAVNQVFITIYLTNIQHTLSTIVTAWSVITLVYFVMVLGFEILF
uniref:S-adenosylmethionine:tRNA ribosyltransferase-isomerase n=1 Tax=Lygus hesperus TaxID=30085 RepID=A0A0A9ZBE1_LYGHE